MGKRYTKTGDKGKTSLLDGTVVSKHDIRVEAYGTIDELSSFIGMLRGQILEKKHIDSLLLIQEKLFTMGSILAANNNIDLKKTNLIITNDDVVFLEKEIDTMNETLEKLTAFIIPGGHSVVSYSHICRSITRRAERIVVALNEQSKVDSIIIQFLNRLSDYFFTLSRWAEKEYK